MKKGSYKRTALLLFGIIINLSINNPSLARDKRAFEINVDPLARRVLPPDQIPSSCPIGFDNSVLDPSPSLENEKIVNSEKALHHWGGLGVYVSCIASLYDRDALEGDPVGEYVIAIKGISEDNNVCRNVGTYRIELLKSVFGATEHAGVAEAYYTLSLIDKYCGGSLKGARNNMAKSMLLGYQPARLLYDELFK